MSLVRREETWRIVEDLLQNMSFTLSGGSNVWTDNLDGTFTLLLCKTYWLETQETITINSVDYSIIEVVKDTSVTITSISAPLLNTFTIDAPNFYSGTIIQTNLELSQDSKDVSARTPMAYLFRDIEDTFLPLDSVIERETPIRLFFLDDENFADMSSESNSDEVLEPMRQMAYYFVNEILEKNKKIGKLDANYSIRDYSKFGVENASGYTENIFNDQLSGVELSITIPILRDYTCGC